MTDLLLSNLCKNIGKESMWKFIDIFPNQVLNFLKISSLGMEKSLQIIEAQKEVQWCFEGMIL